MGNGLKRIKTVSNSIQQRFSEIAGKAEPQTYKIPRPLLLQLDTVQKTLFDELENRGTGVYKISGLTLKLSERQLYGSLFALAQINSNQSYMSGHEEENTGIAGKNKDKVKVSEVYFSLNDFCKLSNGLDDPSTRDRKASEELLKTLDTTPAVVEYGGKKIEAFLAKTATRVTEKDGSIYYHLFLHPIFVDVITKGYAQLPQNIMKRLRIGVGKSKNITGAHLKLLALLAQQTRGKDEEKLFTRTAYEILQYLNLVDVFHNQRKRTLKQLDDICKAVKTTGVITRYSIVETTSNGKKVFNRIEFYLNPNFVKDDPLKKVEKKK